MSTQLRLVEPTESAPRPRRRPAASPRAKVVPASRGRRVQWDTEWRLSTKTRRIGREGVAAARAALEHADRPPDLRREPFPQAS
jgi:hypothetical protein